MTKSTSRLLSDHRCTPAPGDLCAQASPKKAFKPEAAAEVFEPMTEKDIEMEELMAKMQVAALCILPLLTCSLDSACSNRLLLTRRCTSFSTQTEMLVCLCAKGMPGMGNMNMFNSDDIAAMGKEEEEDDL